MREFKTVPAPIAAAEDRLPASPAAATAVPLQPPNPLPCSEPGCTWTAAYRDGANASAPYCARHGPFASLCPACGGSDVWIDLSDRTHCATCTPKTALSVQISAVLTDIDGDPDLR